MTLLGLLGGIVVAALAFWFAYGQSSFAEVSTCSDDPMLLFERNASHVLDAIDFRMTSCDAFSLGYVEARAKFRTAVQSIPTAELRTIVLDDNDNDDLTIDVAILPGDNDATIVHSSGMHGVEGYSGSAIQLAFLHWYQHHRHQQRQQHQQHQQQQADNDNAMPTFVFVHAVNPYGMKHYRRVNENNVDLNRNAITDFPKFLDERPENIANYDGFRPLISPQHAPSLWDETLGYWITAVRNISKHGLLAIKRAMVAGQYHHPSGCFYGGRDLQQSLRKLFQLVESDTSILDDAAVWVDVHTGLGPFGKDTLMMSSAPQTAHPDEHHEAGAEKEVGTVDEDSGDDDGDGDGDDERGEAHQSVASSHVMDHILSESRSNKEGRRRLFASAFDIVYRDVISLSESAAASEDEIGMQSDASAGYDLTQGMVVQELAQRQYRKKTATMEDENDDNTEQRTSDGVQKYISAHPPMLPNIFTNQEFGTLPPVLVGRSLILENAIHHHSSDPDQHEFGRLLMQRAFYPSSTKWRRSIFQRGLGLLFDSIEYSTIISKQRKQLREATEALIADGGDDEQQYEDGTASEVLGMEGDGSVSKGGGVAHDDANSEDNEDDDKHPEL